MDELWSFVGNKDNKQWVWLALNPDNRQIIAIHIGGRGSEDADLFYEKIPTLLASLAGCTLSTLRMYIDRKGWDISEISVQLNMNQETENGLLTTIKRVIQFSETVPFEQKERLLYIASKCPISKILENKIVINTTA